MAWQPFVYLLFGKLSLFVSFHNRENLVVEQVVENSIGRADYEVAQLCLTCVFIGAVRCVLAHIVLACLQHLPQLHAFLDFASKLELLNVLLSGQD